MSTSPWAALDRRRRRRAVANAAFEVAIAWVLLFGIYYLIPSTDRTSASALVRLVVGMVGFAAVLAWQLREVVRAELPGLRAGQALGVVIPVFLVVFAVIYLSLTTASSDHFSEPLDHTGALYLTITVFSTVGFGDITPVSSGARIAVSIQMLLDLVILGAVVRALGSAAKTSLGSRSSDEP